MIKKMVFVFFAAISSMQAHAVVTPQQVECAETSIKDFLLKGYQRSFPGLTQVQLDAGIQVLSPVEFWNLENQEYFIISSLRVTFRNLAASSKVVVYTGPDADSGTNICGIIYEADADKPDAQIFKEIKKQFDIK
jgi:hypothetical protein